MLARSLVRPLVRSSSRSLAWTGDQRRKLATFALVGDSNGDRATSVAYPTAQNAICYDQRAWGSLIEQFAGGRIRGLGPTGANTYKVGALWDRDHGYSGITSYKMVNGDAVYGSLIPIEDAIAANPDFFIVNIGTNDASDQTAATVIARNRAVWARLVATGKPVIGTDILQRASAHNSVGVRDTINAVNAAQRATWAADGLWKYRQWDDLVLKDGGTGYALSSEYPDNFRVSPGPDGIHWGIDLSRRLANDLVSCLQPYWTGAAVTIPADGHASWVTPNAYVAGDVSGLATGWANNFLDAGGAFTPSKFTDSQGTWQRINIATQRTYRGSWQSEGIYSKITTGAAAYIGTQVRPTARIRIPTGQNLSSVGISVQCIGAANPWTYNATPSWAYTLCPVSEFDAQIYCDPFTVPTGTTQIWFMINPGSGTGIFDFQKAGIVAA
jgi:lysophospholipase L1-like esterase